MCRNLEYLTERRTESRITNPFAVSVRGTNLAGRAFQSDSVVDNLSSGGLYLRLEGKMPISSRVLVVIRFTPQLRVALSGVVLRSEALLDGRAGVAVKIKRHRFLYEGQDP